MVKRVTDYFVAAFAFGGACTGGIGIIVPERLIFYLIAALANAGRGASGFEIIMTELGRADFTAFRTIFLCCTGGGNPIVLRLAGAFPELL